MRAVAAVLLWAVTAVAGQAEPAITVATLADPTDRYGHGALGPSGEWGALRVTVASDDGTSSIHEFVLPEDLVFEDVAARLLDVTGDGRTEVLVVQSQRDRGARLLVIGLTARGRPEVIAATGFLGRRHRWLAPVGAADLDGDGRIEIAYVETPHLGRTLRIVRVEGDRLAPVEAVPGLTNHRFGEAAIQGGIALCDGRPTVLTADAGWRRIVGTAFDGRAATSRDFGPYLGPESLASVAGCRDL